MGDPKKQRKKYSTPMHPWQKERIDEEKAILTEFGLKNKKEIWRMASRLAKFKDQTKKLAAMVGEHADEEKQELLKKVKSLALLGETGKIDDILDLNVREILERRLQTVVFRKGLARSISQARQMITHEHVTVNGIKVTAPGYLVSVEEEPTIAFISNSPFFSDDHPERAIEAQLPKKPEAKDDKNDKEKKETVKKAEKKESKDDKKDAKEKKGKPEKKTDDKKAPKKEKEEKPKEEVKNE